MAEHERDLVDWRSSPTTAQHWRPLDGSTRVECTLSPRHCKIADGGTGFCGVRRNIGGTLYTDNYGKAVAAAEEVIETEAIYHYRPGARILSMGNIGCMMSCRFCQNWTTSQVRHLDTRVIQAMSPSDVVRLATDNGIGIISWTYNDPVVWHEFVVETSRLAQDAGLRSLFKSALYIEAAPLEELLEVIDIWSISLKSLDASFYKKVTGATLEPVLQRIREVKASARHLEISQLLVTGMNDNEDAIRRTIDWHLANVGADVPLHFVRFHPAFRYRDVERTSKTILLRAAEMARERGIAHVYLGNLTIPGVGDTLCRDCGKVLVTRFGLTTDVVGIAADGSCAGCGAAVPIVEPRHDAGRTVEAPVSRGELASTTHEWSDEVNSIHIESMDLNMAPVDILVRRAAITEVVRVGGRLSRALVSRRNDAEKAVTLQWPVSADVRVVPVLDRAHLFTGDN